MATVEALCRLAVDDPHLIRLGQFLASSSLGSEDELETSFAEEPWLSWLKIEFVEEPG